MGLAQIIKEQCFFFYSQRFDEAQYICLKIWSCKCLQTSFGNIYYIKNKAHTTTWVNTREVVECRKHRAKKARLIKYRD